MLGHSTSLWYSPGPTTLPSPDSYTEKWANQLTKLTSKCSPSRDLHFPELAQLAKMAGMRDMRGERDGNFGKFKNKMFGRKFVKVP